MVELRGYTTEGLIEELERRKVSFDKYKELGKFEKFQEDGREGVMGIVEKMPDKWIKELTSCVSEKGALFLDWYDAEDLRDFIKAKDEEIERLREVLFGEETLEMLLAGKKSLFSCSEDPQLEDARSCFQAMVEAAFSKKDKA